MKGRVDFAQAGSIARAALVQEFRRPRGAAGRKGRLSGIFASVIIYVFAGFFSASSLLQGVDPFTVEFLSTSAFMLLVAVFIVMEFSTLVTGAEDLSFYLPLPVSSRTYVAAKLGVTCMFALGLSLLYSLPAAILLPIFRRPLWLLGIHIFAVTAGGLTACLLVTSLLGLAVRFVSYKRVREVASWIQLLIFFAVYGGYSIFQRALTGAGALKVAPSAPLMLAPSAWVPVLLAENFSLSGLGAVLAVAVPCLLFIAALRVVSHAYDGKITESAGYAPGIRSGRLKQRTQGKRTGSLLWGSPEEKGISLLIRRLFTRDSQFRMGILVIVPVTVLYLFLVLFVYNTPILDPFTPRGRDTFTGTLLVYLAVGFFPSYLKNALTYSNQAEAGWILHSSPADPRLVLRAARRFILLFFIAPYLGVLGLVYMVMTGAVAHTLQHFAVISLLILMETDFILFFFPQMPFSRQAATGRRSGAALLRLVSGVIVLLPIFLFVYFVYPFEAAYWASLAGLAALMIAMRLFGERYAARKLSSEEFAL